MYLSLDGPQQISGSCRLFHSPVLLSLCPALLRASYLKAVSSLWFSAYFVCLWTRCSLCFEYLFSYYITSSDMSLRTFELGLCLQSSPCFSLPASHSSSHTVFLLCFILDPYNTQYTFLTPFCTGQSLLTCSPAILPHFRGPLKYPCSNVCSKAQPCSLPWNNLIRAGQR